MTVCLSVDVSCVDTDGIDFFNLLNCHSKKRKTALKITKTCPRSLCWWMEWDGTKTMTKLHHVVQKYSDIAVPNLEFFFGKDLIYFLCLLLDFLKSCI